MVDGEGVGCAAGILHGVASVAFGEEPIERGDREVFEPFGVSAIKIRVIEFPRTVGSLLLKGKRRYQRPLSPSAVTDDHAEEAGLAAWERVRSSVEDCVRQLNDRVRGGAGSGVRIAGLA